MDISKGWIGIVGDRIDLVEDVHGAVAVILSLDLIRVDQVHLAGITGQCGTKEKDLKLGHPHRDRIGRIKIIGILQFIPGKAGGKPNGFIAHALKIVAGRAMFEGIP